MLKATQLVCPGTRSHCIQNSRHIHSATLGGILWWALFLLSLSGLLSFTVPLIHSFIPSTSIYRVPTVCQAFPWSVPVGLPGMGTDGLWGPGKEKTGARAYGAL